MDRRTGDEEKDMRLDVGFGGSLGLRLRAEPETVAIASATLLLKTTNLDLQYRFRCFGWDLARLASSLRALRVGSADAAEFESFDGSTRIEWSHPDERVDLLRVVVELEAQAVEPEFRERLRFRGTVDDRSALAARAEPIETFLLETGLDTEHPHTGRADL